MNCTFELKKINGSTMHEYMVRLGHGHDIRKKTYCVDTHENAYAAKCHKSSQTDVLLHKLRHIDGFIYRLLMLMT